MWTAQIAAIKSDLAIAILNSVTDETDLNNEKYNELSSTNSTISSA